MLAGVFKFFGDLLTFVGPLCIARIITYVEEMRAENGEPRTLPQVSISQSRELYHRYVLKGLFTPNESEHECGNELFHSYLPFFYFKFDFELVGNLVFPRSVSLNVTIPQSLMILSEKECDVTDM